MNIFDLIQTKPLSEFERRSLNNKMIRNLKQNSGKNTPFLFEIGEECFDIITYKTPEKCIITDRYNENGWNKYCVKSGKREYGLREKDLKKIEKEIK